MDKQASQQTRGPGGLWKRVQLSVWYDVQALADIQSLTALPQDVWGLSVDGFYASIKGQDSDMIVAVDIGTGNPMTLARIDEKDQPVLFAWLAQLE